MARGTQQAHRARRFKRCVPPRGQSIVQLAQNVELELTLTTCATW
jgi:hypothetical protein